MRPIDVTRLPDEVNRRQDELVSLLQDLIRIESVNTGRPESGNERAVADYLQSWLGERGTASRAVEPAPGRTNLIVDWGDWTQRPRLLYLAHTDVVPIEDPAGWSHGPFSGDIAEGRVWGRGALDCKGMVACEMLALSILDGSGLAPRGALRLAITADEEAGSSLGAKWLAENMPDEVSADYALNEGPGLPVRSRAGCGYLLPVGGKGAVNAHISIHGRSYHSSQPWRADNALVKMAEVIRRIDAYVPEKDVSNPIFGYLGRMFGLPEEVTPENIDEVLEKVQEQSLAFAHRLKALSRLSLAPTMGRAGIKDNNIPELAELVVNSRVLPGQSAGTVLGILQTLLGDIPGVEIVVEAHAEPSASPHDTPFAEAVRRAMVAATGRDDIFLVPTLMGGCADSRYIRPLGAVVYDFWPFHPNADVERYTSHCTDESIEIQTLVDSARMMVALACDLLGSEPGGQA